MTEQDKDKENELKKELKENMDYLYDGLLCCFSLVECFYFFASYDPKEKDKYSCIVNLKKAFKDVIKFLRCNEEFRGDLVVIHGVFGAMIGFIITASQASFKFKKEILSLDPSPMTKEEKNMSQNFAYSSVDAQDKVHDIVTSGDYHKETQKIMLQKFEEAIAKLNSINLIYEKRGHNVQ